uniref:Ig-like domain-containing protein n=1 Tax=Latimeria chalumnae TaxID=7897 RepID=H3A4G9_LATCH
SITDNSCMTVPDEVIAVKGESVVLPCRFTLPNKGYSGEVEVTWRKDTFYTGAVVFQWSYNINAKTVTLTGCKTAENEESRYQLVGNLKENDVSLQIEDVIFEDKNIYFCHVELTQQSHKMYETQTGTNLRVLAPPRILNLSVTVNSSLGYRILQCIVEGEPLPNITWIGPGKAELHKESNNIIVTPFPEEHQMMSEIYNVTQDGIYTCRAVTNCGGDEENIHV